MNLGRTAYRRRFAFASNTSTARVAALCVTACMVVIHVPRAEAQQQANSEEVVELPEISVTAEQPKSGAARKRKRRAASASGSLDKSVVVSGEKIERGIDNTASSVTVFTDVDLEKKLDDHSVTQAVEDVPNVSYGSTTGQAPIIRGQDTQGPNTGTFAFLGGTVPRATINLDGHYLSYYEYVFGSTSIWDVESIEVFRGPQTTSQGANAIAGAIIVNTKDPTFTPEGAAQVQFGSRGMKRTSLALSGPISNELAGRIALDYYARDTYVDYVNPNFVAGATDQDLESISGRVKLLWRPVDIPGLEAKLTYVNNRNTTPTYEAVNAPFDELESRVDAWPSLKVRNQSGISDVTYDFKNGMIFFNQTQYSDSFTDRITQPANAASATIDRQNISNDSRLTFGDARDVVSGVAGVFVAHTTSDETLDQTSSSPTWFSQFDDTKDNLGFYGELSYHLTERWTLTGGLRYQRDFIQRSGTYEPYAAAVDYGQTFDAWLPKLSLAYAVTPDITVGALVNKGYNPGGVGLDLYRRNWFTFEDESLWNYELFTRMHLLNNRLHVNANVFFMDMKNSQRLVQQSVDNVLQYFTVNADEAESYGAELAANYLLFDNFRLTAGLGLLQTKITKFSSAAVVYEGNEFAISPGYMFNIGFDWDITPKLNLAAEVRHKDGYYSDDANDPAYRVEAYTVANVRTTYKVTDNAEIFGYVNNIFDDRSPTFLMPGRSVATRGQTEAAVVPPREFIGGLKVNF